jgi:hypothetical protein
MKTYLGNLFYCLFFQLSKPDTDGTFSFAFYCYICKEFILKPLLSVNGENVQLFSEI